jgi:hypothetical protein
MSATANPLPEWLPAQERSWVASHEAALETIVAAFTRHGQWPDPVAVERELRSRGTKIGLIAAISTMPQSLGRREHSPSRVVLTLFGLGCVASAAWILDAYVAGLQFALSRFDDPTAPSALTRADLQEHVQLDDLSMDIVSTVILLPGNPFLSGGQASVEAWRLDIDERVTTYEHAVTADALLAQLARERLTPSSLPPPSPPSSAPATIEPRDWLIAAGLVLAVCTVAATLIGIVTAPLPLAVGVVAACIVALTQRRQLHPPPPSLRAVAAVAASGVLAAALTWALEDQEPGAKSASTAVAGLRGGCAPFQIHAQNRWAPLGTTVHAQPNVLSTEMSTFPGNKSLSVNGWLHGRAAYPTNTPPWNSDIWFHLASGIGWVNFAAVRALPTSPDVTGLADDGGTPAPTPPQCQGALG